jgi:hypothetical protein
MYQIIDIRGGPGGGGGPPGLPIIILDILTPGVEGPLVNDPSSLDFILGEGVLDLVESLEDPSGRGR